MKLSIHIAGVLCLLLGVVQQAKAQQPLYDESTIQKIEITFTQPNWDFILDTAKMGADGYTMAAKVVINGVEFDSVGVKYKGNSSYDSTYKKNPWNISLDEYKSQNYLGIKSIKLANCFSDPSMIRDVLGYSIARTYMDAPRANFAEVYVNGTLIGLYSNTESINKQFCSDHFSSSKNTFISCSPLVVPTPQTKSNLRYAGADSTSYMNNYELKSTTGWNDLVTLCDSITNKPASFENVIDADRTIWMLAFNSALVNLDSYTGVFCQNYYLYKDATGRFNPIPWDLNMSFGGFPFVGSSNTSMGNLSITALQQLSPTIHATDKYWPLINIVMGNATYKRQYFAHLKTIVEEQFGSDKYILKSDTLRKTITAAVMNDNNKFYSTSQFQTAMNTNVNVGSYEVPGIKTLIDARVAYLQTLPEFKATAPTISVITPKPVQVGTNVTITATITNANSNGVYAGVRYDKSDKFHRTYQMFDDGLHNDAAANDGVFGCTLTMNKLSLQYYIYAENDNAGMFSPRRAEHEYYILNAKMPTPKPGEVVINEFVASNSSGVTDEEDKYEDWIELYNTTNSALDLYGVYITDKFTSPQKNPFPEGTTIPAKGFLVLWADEDSTTKEYIHVNFKLSASGEQLMLTGSDNEVIDSVTFGAQLADVSQGRCPDGVGTFMEIIKPTFGKANTCATDVEITVEQPIVQVYPNPAATNVRVQTSLPGTHQLLVYNSLGQLVYSTQINGTLSIPLDVFAPDVYVLNIGNTQRTLVIAK